MVNVVGLDIKPEVDFKAGFFVCLGLMHTYVNVSYFKSTVSTIMMRPCGKNVNVPGRGIITCFEAMAVFIGTGLFF